MWPTIKNSVLAVFCFQHLQWTLPVWKNHINRVAKYDTKYLTRIGQTNIESCDFQQKQSNPTCIDHYLIPFHFDHKALHCIVCYPISIGSAMLMLGFDGFVLLSTAQQSRNGIECVLCTFRHRSFRHRKWLAKSVCVWTVYCVCITMCFFLLLSMRTIAEILDGLWTFQKFESIFQASLTLKRLKPHWSNVSKLNSLFSSKSQRLNQKRGMKCAWTWNSVFGEG